MPTTDERREVAARLRKLEAKNHWEKSRFIVGFIEALGLETRANVGECLLHLADLIEPEPERTCRIRQHRCTNCDHEINNKAYFVKIELGDGIWTVGSRTANYCPNCGCRIKEEPDAD